MSFRLLSSELTEAGVLPKAQVFNAMGFDEGNTSPQLTWENAPEGTKSKRGRRGGARSRRCGSSYKASSSCTQIPHRRRELSRDLADDLAAHSFVIRTREHRL